MNWFRYSDRWSDRHYRALINCRNALACPNQASSGSNRRPRQRDVGGMFPKYWAYEMAEEDGLIARDAEGRLKVAQFLSDPPEAADRLLFMPRCRDAFRRMEAEAPGRERTSKEVVQRLASEGVFHPNAEMMVLQAFHEWTEVREVQPGTYVAYNDDDDDYGGVTVSSSDKKPSTQDRRHDAVVPRPERAAPTVGPAAQGERVRAVIRQVLAEGPLQMKDIVSSARTHGLTHSALDGAIRVQLKKMEDVVNLEWGVYGLEGALDSRPRVPSEHPPATDSKPVEPVAGGGRQTGYGRYNPHVREVIREQLRRGDSSLKEIAAAITRAGYDYSDPRVAAREFMATMPDVFKVSWGIYGLQLDPGDGESPVAGPSHGTVEPPEPSAAEIEATPEEHLEPPPRHDVAPEASLDELRQSVRKHAVSLLRMQGSMQFKQLVRAVADIHSEYPAALIEEILRGLPGFKIAKDKSAR